MIVANNKISKNPLQLIPDSTAFVSSPSPSVENMSYAFSSTSALQGGDRGQIARTAAGTGFECRATKPRCQKFAGGGAYVVSGSPQPYR